MSTDAGAGTRPRSRLERRVAAAAEALLAHNGSVSPVDVLVAIGWLPQSMIDGWRQGRVECLEHLAPVRPDKLAAALEHLRGWAAGNELAPSEVTYLAATRDRRPLRFTADGDQATERAWRTHWMRADLPQAARERRTRRQSKPPDLVVVEPLNEWSCTACGGSGWLLLMEGPGPLCMDCADLGHLVFLPAGNAALSRRAKQASRLSAVVVRFSRARKRYERQGILVEEAALQQAEAQCLADQDARGRRRERDRQRPAPTRTWYSRRGWPRRWAACSRAARRGAPRRSPSMPRCGAAAGSAGRRPGARWTSRRSCWRWWPRCGTRTPTTTSC
jgi:hypothetical protein